MVVLAPMVSMRAQAAANPGNDSRAVAAMLSQYETVFYTNTDLSSKFSSFKGLSRQVAGALSVPFGDLIYGLDLLGPYASADLLAKSEAVLMGGKGFVPSEGEGAAQVSRFCYIVTFGVEVQPDFQKYAAKAHKTSMAGGTVWSWQVHSPDPRGQTVTYYAAQIRDSYLVVSNDLGELQAITRKFTSSGDYSTTLSGIRDYECTFRIYRDPAGALQFGFGAADVSARFYVAIAPGSKDTHTGGGRFNRPHIDTTH